MADMAEDMTRQTAEAGLVTPAEPKAVAEPAAEMATGTPAAEARTETKASPEAGAVPDPAGADHTRPEKIGTGPGRLLLSLYGVFTVAALSRSIVQISTKFHDAPLAYVLSGVAGLVYAVITVALWRGGEAARRLALVCCSVELAGVIAVGVLSIADSAAFPDATVWSDFGDGYGFLPLLLPVAGLLWLRRAARGTPAPSRQTGTEA